MSDPFDKRDEQTLQVYDLMMRLHEAEETLAAIRRGDVDALVVKTPSGQHIYTLQGADNAYRLLLETLNEGAVTLALDSTILYANARFAALVETPLQRVIGKEFGSFVCETEHPLFRTLFDRGTRGSSKGELWLERGDGGPVPVMLSLNSVGTDGVGRTCTAVVTDLTEIREAQSALSRANLELRAAHHELTQAHNELEARVQRRTAELAGANQALKAEIARRQHLEEELRLRADALAEGDRRKDEFLSMLSHELRNPLSPALTALQVMRRAAPPDPKYLRSCEVAERQLQHLSRLVDDLLDVSRITQGRIELRPQPLDLGLAVRRAVEAVHPLIAAQGHEVSLSVPECPLGVHADPTRLEQIVSNLVTNAAKYTDQGGKIWITAAAENGDVVLRVRDNGLGIPAETLPHVFDLFVQAERSLDRAQGGLGIGLTLVRRLVEMHDGTVSVASPGPMQGTEFTVRLPAVEPPAPQRPGEAPARAIGPRRVLVVDDNVDAAETLAELLTMDGHNVEVAHSGPAALARVVNQPPDVVLCDIGMPGMDGFEVARRLSILDGARPLLIALTGYGQESDRRRSAEAGFDHHVIKPLDPEELRRLLHQSAARKPKVRLRAEPSTAAP